jgi:D-alanyl-D-alanine carboxypeptidase
MVKNIILLFVFLAFSFQNAIDYTIDSLEVDLQNELNAIVNETVIPGITLAIQLDDYKTIKLAAGFAEKEHRQMQVDDRMLGGSTGKMYVSAIALGYIEKGQLNLKDKISTFFSNEEWFDTLPNAADITIKDLMQHTTGLPRYIFQREFIESIRLEPLKARSPVDCIRYVLDKDPLFAVGNGFAYSDTNYLILGLVLESISKEAYNNLLQTFLDKNGLTNTNPTILRKQEGLVQGYIGSQNFFGLPLEMVQDGKLAINPAFEWTGGGTTTNVSDLSKLAYTIHKTRLLDSTTYALFISPVNMRSGESHHEGYGLGTFVWSQEDDLKYGHSGFFPGYQTHVEYSTKRQYSIAIQINTDDGSVNLRNITHRLEKILLKYLD